MTLFVDSENKVRSVNSTPDDTLTPLYVDENNDNFPFKGWSTAKICCYKVNVSDGVITMMTPYRPSSTLDYIDEIGKEAEANADKAEAFDILIGDKEVEE